MSSHNQPESGNAAASSFVERRRNLRFPFSATVEAIDTKSSAKISGRASDFCRGGCYVDTLSPFPAGTEAKLRISRGNETFEAHVRVIYSLMGMGMGLAFVSAQPKQIRLLQRWLSELSGESAPKQDPSEQEATGVAPTERTQMMKSGVLCDLIMTLIQKKVLTEREGKDLLGKLFL
jgi:hypothetical protein